MDYMDNNFLERSFQKPQMSYFCTLRLFLSNGMKYEMFWVISLILCCDNWSFTIFILRKNLKSPKGFVCRVDHSQKGWGSPASPTRLSCHSTSCESSSVLSDTPCHSTPPPCTLHSTSSSQLIFCTIQGRRHGAIRPIAALLIASMDLSVSCIFS